MSIPDSQALLDIVHRADLGILVGRWGYQPDPAALPAAYERLTAHAHAADCRYWLQDIRRRTANDPATTAWLLSEYFPAMALRLGPQLCVAYLTSPALHQAIREGPGFADVGDYEGRPFAVAFFGDEGAAVAWLYAQQQSQDAVSRSAT
ncbi:hypothetical protein [Hymenobacter coccineus]|uniref:STAS/SEC14 domain-containing protein n=1 Tax=Hymenobacter coccineus TaxID=1908235 RepID=A0A1G1THD2_9BACT|nr:hypothetical protein [Hymenobacter coccineus]OGX90289.1 hypothetical protein BEN49_06940 [Hymenobacter coccineus]